MAKIPSLRDGMERNHIANSGGDYRMQLGCCVSRRLSPYYLHPLPISESSISANGWVQ